MSNVREEMLKKIKNMTPNEFKASQPEETTTMKIKRAVKKVKKVANFVGIGTGTGISSGVRGSSSTRDFRESHHVHVEPLGPSLAEREQELRNMKAYLESIDGKGDHDCGHEH